MRTLHAMVLRTFLPMLLISVLFFVLILQLVDIFTYIWRYVSYDVSILQILRVQMYYLPKCISYALSPSLLFSISFTLGTYYANNELISIFGAGVSLYRLVLPLLFVGVLLSVGGFYFQEKVVIDTYRIKNQLSQELVRQQTSLSNTNVTVISNDNHLVYYADFYNDTSQTLRNVIVIERDNQSHIVLRVDGEQAVWKGDHWVIENARVFTRNPTTGAVEEKDAGTFTRPDFNEPPSTFRKTVRNVDEMGVSEANQWIKSLQKAGLPYRGPLTELYKRYSFSLTPLVVAIIACAVGGRFRRNIVLMSLLASLSISVVYYVAQMVTVIVAKLGAVSPLMGASAPLLVFLAGSVWLLSVART